MNFGPIQSVEALLLWFVDIAPGLQFLNLVRRQEWIRKFRVRSVSHERSSSIRRITIDRHVKLPLGPLPASDGGPLSRSTRHIQISRSLRILQPLRWQ